jgi:hypothetical protein
MQSDTARRGKKFTSRNIHDLIFLDADFMEELKLILK